MNTREAKNFVRKCRLSNNTILLVKEGSEVAQQKELIGRAIKESGLTGIIMLIVEDMDDVKVLNTIDMNRLGWFRKEEITRLLTSRSVKPQKAKGENVESS